MIDAIGGLFDPLFDLLAGLLAWFYSLIPSYGISIILLTIVVLTVFMPLTYRSTKSIVAMRRLQPQLKRIQKRYAQDREAMQRETMALYQQHGVSPLSGCLPILVQSPVFIVMFRVIRGITRRSSTIGFSAGDVTTGFALRQDGSVDPGFTAAEVPLRNFNPDLTSDNELYEALVNDNEMMWIGLDLARTPFEVLAQSVTKGLPYVLMIALVAFLGWYQQRQIAGRATGEISQQQQLIMKVMPWFLPVFAFTMPAGLVLYFIVSSLLRVGQQAYITRSVYGDEELTKPLEVDDDWEDDDEEDDGTPANPLEQLFGGSTKAKTKEAPQARHGSRRPTSSNASARKRTRPPRDSDASANGANKVAPTSRTSPKNDSVDTSSAKKKKNAGADAPTEEKATGWARAKRSGGQNRAQNKKTQQDDKPAKPTSKRVTPKADTQQASNRRKRR